MPVWLLTLLAVLFGLPFLHALVTGRVLAVWWLRRSVWADRRDTPFFYWLFTGITGLIFAYALSALAEGVVPNLDLPWFPL